jgi:hypothetical protein
VTQLSLADALSKQDAGIARAEANDHNWIEAMREIARRICADRGSVSVDDLRIHASIRDLGSPISSHAWGAILLKSVGFVRIGDKISEYPGNNGRRIGVFRLTQMGDAR